MKRLENRSRCPINFALETFGDKWSLLVVRDIIFFGKRTYGEFLESEENIATNILADRLALLEHKGILTKTPHPTDKRRDVYLLTPKGLDLIPVLLQIEVWSAHHDPKTTTLPSFVTQIEKNAKKMSEKIRESVVAGQRPFCP